MPDTNAAQHSGRKVFWLSFCDAERPKGDRFLGVCLVEVTGEEAAEMAPELWLRFGRAQPESEWLAAALRKTHRLGCNPGGEVASMEIDPEHPNLKRYQFGVLMDRPTIEVLESQVG